MKIIVETEASAEVELFTLAEILCKLRYNTKIWEENYGSANRYRMNFWAEKADRWIEQHVKLA